MGCHFLLQCMKVKSQSEVIQSCPTLSDPMGCSLPGSNVHGLFQTRELEWGDVSIAMSNGLFSVFFLYDIFEMPDSVNQSKDLIYSQALYRHPFSAHYSTPSVCTSFPSEQVYTRQTSLSTIILRWQHILLVLNSTLLSPNHLSPNVTMNTQWNLFTCKPAAMAFRSWTVIQKAWIKSQVCVSLRVSPCLSEPQFTTLWNRDFYPALYDGHETLYTCKHFVKR